MKIVRLLLLVSISTYILKCIKLKNKVKYSNYLVGMSSDELEKQSHTMNLKYNDLLNVFIDKNYDETPKNTPQTSLLQISQNNNQVVTSGGAGSNLKISKDEMDIWDS
jgi:hypothetical protein